MTIIEYVIEEVTRQGHDVTIWMDGGRRVAWMLQGWEYAVNASQGGRMPSIYDIEQVGRMVEKEVNAHGFRTCNVMVGLTKMMPSPQEVPALLERLWPALEDMDPIAAYKAFENIHPFGDGNGRTGKILLNWLNHSLDNNQPRFPPPDLWGRVIRNP